MTWHFRFGFVFGDHRSNLLKGSNWSDFILGFGGDDEIYAGILRQTRADERQGQGGESAA